MGIYLALSFSLFILLAAAFATWSAKLSMLSAESREEFGLSLSGKRIANALDIVKRNNVGLEFEISKNISFQNGIRICETSCIIIASLPPGQFEIITYPRGLRIEK